MELKQDMWRDFIDIISEFGYLMNENDKNIENQRFVWEIIVNIKENMKEEIEQAIRMNLNLCYILEEDSQMKDINTELFKLNFLLDQNIYRLDHDVKKGLSSFHKLIISTYGNIEMFINNLKSVNENLSFIRNRKDQTLIKKYNYLKNISLPLRGYEDLRIALITLLKKFTDIKLVITKPKIFNEFNEDIDIFIKKYKNIYKKEHNEYHKNLKEFYQQLYNLPEYTALEKLSNINVINVAYNLKPIKRYIETFFPEQCTNYNLDETMEKQVKCFCGFNIGETLAIPSLNKIKPMLRKGIIEYIEKIQNDKFKPLFNNYLSYNKESMINKFLEFKTDKINGNLKYIDSQLISEINEALSNTYPLKITLDELAPHLTGTYPINQIDLVGKDLEDSIKSLINSKIQGMEKINYDDIIVNLVYMQDN